MVKLYCVVLCRPLRFAGGSMIDGRREKEKLGGSGKSNPVMGRKLILA
jgi:hypothetical protein